MIGDMLQGLIESVRAEERKNYVLRILAVIGAIAAIAAIAYGIYRFLTPDYFDDYDDDDSLVLNRLILRAARLSAGLPFILGCRRVEIRPMREGELV